MNNYEYKGMVPKDPNELDRATMSHEELARFQGEHGEVYRGMVENPDRLDRATMSHEELTRFQGENGEVYRGMVENPDKLDRATMSHEELVHFQGEHGEIYRGMVENPNKLDQATMTHEELVRFQGENGEIYRGMVPEDPKKYRMRMTGTENVDISKIANELMSFNMRLNSNPEFLDSKVAVLLQETPTISKVMERRMKKTTDILYEYGDFNKEQIYTDLSIISSLYNCGYDFSDFEIDLSIYLGEDPRMADIESLLEYYKDGLLRKKDRGNIAEIPNPLSPNEKINAEDFVETLQNLITQKLNAKSASEYEDLKNKLDSMSSLNTKIMGYEIPEEGIQR